jgi:DNA-binding NtrC family response regulator
VLQDGEFTRLGGTHTLRANARVLAATNKRLDEAITSGQFREDLFYRLGVVHIEIPPLRVHLEDVPVLSEEILARYSERYGGDGTGRLPPRLMEAFCKYDWPGNVRQLENAIRQYLILQDEGIVLEDLGKSCHLRPPAAAPPKPEVPGPASPQSHHSLKDVGAAAADRAEMELVLRRLEEARWNRKQVARDLRISYKGLLMKLQRWGIPGRQAVR